MLQGSTDGQPFIAAPYNPKDRREIRKAVNNIYVKNYPENWDEAKLR